MLVWLFKILEFYFKDVVQSKINLSAVNKMAISHLFDYRMTAVLKWIKICLIRQQQQTKFCSGKMYFGAKKFTYCFKSMCGLAEKCRTHDH